MSFVKSSGRGFAKSRASSFVWCNLCSHLACCDCRRNTCTTVFLTLAARLPIPPPLLLTNDYRPTSIQPWIRNRASHLSPPPAFAIYPCHVQLMHMTKSLVERAEQLQMKVGRRRRFIAPDHQQLAVAWLDGKVTFTQVAKVMNFRGHSVYGFLATALKAARQSKLL